MFDDSAIPGAIQTTCRRLLLIAGRAGVAYGVVAEGHPRRSRGSTQLDDYR
jgi:hypothetical protein